MDLAGVEPASESSWWASLGVGGKLYGVPCNAEQLLVYDPSSASAPCGVDTRSISEGPGKWRAAVALGGKIYAVPDRAEQLLVFDIATAKVKGVDIRRVASGHFKYQAAVSLAGKVYGIPYHADKLLVYDPETAAVTGVSTTHVATGEQKWVAGVVLDGKVYGIPCNAASILVYDPALRTASGINVEHVCTGKFKWLAATTSRGKLYGIPCHADYILVYDPVTGTAWGVDTRVIASGPGKWANVVSLAGKIYGIPDNADQVLVYDTSTQATTGVDVSSVATGPGKWQNSVVLAGKIHAVPYNANAILVFSPATLEVHAVSTSGITTGLRKWSTGVVLGSRLFGLPYAAKQLLLYEADGTDVNTKRAQDLPAEPGVRLLEDFVAAWLSEWIYQISDVALPCPVPPLTIAGEPVEFLKEKVYEDPLQGGPARVATVIAELPGSGKVLFLVFKGSSFLTDFIVNASVSPDYTPFFRAFGDSTTFVHHGAHHAIAQLRVHQWVILQKQIQEAYDCGASRLVVTGHSLGGQYALAFLLQIFLEQRVPYTVAPTHHTSTETLHPLLDTLRAVVFGAPMCFGAAEGSCVRQDLADFVRDRSVNYIHAGDPAPRLWSELDFEAFMRYSVDWLQGQVSSLSRRLVDYAAGPGGLAKRVQELLQRPDMDMNLLRPAKCYVHLSRICVLAPDFRPWRPLGAERMCIEDHHLSDAYIPALRAAFDPSAPGGLYDDSGRSLVDDDGRGSI